ncbi:MAG TPA: hypothetical protein VHI13_01415 [Candidatus Kapabacteria bacterium]|nr:hypothetical protein [Candidatus Kapabacteria bacterium]
MNYLYNYLALLTREEIARTAALRLAARERDVLDALIAVRAEAAPDRDAVVRSLGISSTHFDKICSRLLRQVYHAIVPEGGMALLYDLNRRVLQNNFMHELRRQEKELAGADVAERARFYMTCFNLMGRVSRIQYNEKLMADLAGQYHRLMPSPDNAVYFEACMIGAMIWNAAALGSNRAVLETVLKRLEANAARIGTHIGPLALYKQYQAYALYFAQLDEQPADRLTYLERAADLCRRHPDVFEEEERVLAECKIAESHYFNSSDLEHAYRLYARQFRDHAAILARDYYHTTKFIQLAIIRRRFGRAEQLLRQRFGLHLSSAHESIGTMGAISWAKLMLASGRAAQAKRYLDFGFAHNRKNFFVQYEIELRLLEAIYFALEGKDEFVERLAEKNLKYLRSKGFTLATSRYYPWAFKLLVGFIDERLHGRQLTPQLRRKLEEFREGPAALYGLLLEAVRLHEQAPEAHGGRAAGTVRPRAVPGVR